MVLKGEELALSAEERGVLEQVCSEIGVPPALVEAVIAEEEKVFGMGRRHGIHDRLDEVFRRFADWEKEEDR